MSMQVGREGGSVHTCVGSQSVASTLPSVCDSGLCIVSCVSVSVQHCVVWVCQCIK